MKIPKICADEDQNSGRSNNSSIKLNQKLLFSDLDQLNFMSEIGRGTSGGRVFKASFKENSFSNEIVAVKLFNPSLFSTSNKENNEKRMEEFKFGLFFSIF